MDIFKKFIVDEINEVLKDPDNSDMLFDLIEDLGIINTSIVKAIKKAIESAKDDMILKICKDYCIDF